jgi:GTP:adenosylcobinamide-phosphate guanylyltransferase
MDAILFAGGIPQPNEPLYSYSEGEPKALIDVAGKPMIQWTLDALSEARAIDRVVIIGLTAKSKLACIKPLTFLPNEGRLLDNVKAAAAKVLELNPKAKYALLVSSDTPAITGEMIDWIVNTCLETKDDLYYNVIRREVMEKRFPMSKRTYTKLKDMDVCGGDTNMVRLAIVCENSEFWNKVFDARKSPVEQATLLGPDILFRLLFRQLTADDVIQRVAAKLDLKGRALICPYPEVGMDVDKPHQLEILRADLAARSRRQRPQASPARKSSARARTKRRPAVKSRGR